MSEISISVSARGLLVTAVVTGDGELVGLEIEGGKEFTDIASTVLYTVRAAQGSAAPEIHGTSGTMVEVLAGELDIDAFVGSGIR